MVREDDKGKGQKAIFPDCILPDQQLATLAKVQTVSFLFKRDILMAGMYVCPLQPCGSLLPQSYMCSLKLHQLP